MGKDVIYERHPLAEVKAFQSPTGMVGSWTQEQAAKVAAHAALLAPKPGVGKGYATGETATSIRPGRVTTGRKGPEVTVSSNTDHATFLHEGTAPHIIKPRRKKKLMFFWRKSGHVIFEDKVFHPGTKANPFLANALRSVFGGPGR